MVLIHLSLVVNGHHQHSQLPFDSFWWNVLMKGNIQEMGMSFRTSKFPIETTQCVSVQSSASTTAYWVSHDTWCWTVGVLRQGKKQTTQAFILVPYSCCSMKSCTSYRVATTAMQWPNTFLEGIYTWHVSTAYRNFYVHKKINDGK